MADFRSIEIDFDIHRLIETERTSFAETANDALRRLLKLPTKATPAPVNKPAGNRRAWSHEGVTLSHGTALRMLYNKRKYEGEIVDGAWVIEGKKYDSPSGAASGVGITKSGHKTRLDGWIYWEVKQPGESQWTRISALRRKAKNL